MNLKSGIEEHIREDSILTNAEASNKYMMYSSKDQLLSTKKNFAASISVVKRIPNTRSPDLLDLVDSEPKN